MVRALFRRARGPSQVRTAPAAPLPCRQRIVPDDTIERSLLRCHDRPSRCRCRRLAYGCSCVRAGRGSSLATASAHVSPCNIRYSYPRGPQRHCDRVHTERGTVPSTSSAWSRRQHAARPADLSTQNGKEPMMPERRRRLMRGRSKKTCRLGTTRRGRFYRLLSMGLALTFGATTVGLSGATWTGCSSAATIVTGSFGKDR